MKTLAHDYRLKHAVGRDRVREHLKRLALKGLSGLIASGLDVRDANGLARTLLALKDVVVENIVEASAEATCLFCHIYTNLILIFIIYSQKCSLFLEVCLHAAVFVLRLKEIFGFYLG